MSLRRAALIALVACCFTPGLVADARAQTRADAPELSFTTAAVLPIGDAIRLFDPARLPAPIVQPIRRFNNPDSPLLLSLYIATGLTQALDIHSTIKALDRGGVETNPMLSGISGNKPAFIALKGAVAAGSILAARKIARKNKVAAIATLIAINTAYGLVAHHNYRVADRLR
jgi:hypothetical protein